MPTVEQVAPLESAQVDFLYWHAVSKTRMADFEGAATLFRLLQAACPDRVDVALGRVYCLIREAEFDSAAAILADLRRRPLRADEMSLLGRLQRRCEFESGRALARRRAVARGGPATPEPVAMPHTLGDDAMARRAVESR